MRKTDLCVLALACLLPLSVSGGAHAQAAFGLGGNEPVEIESDRLEVLDRENIAIFTGNVVLVQGTLLLRTTKLTAFYTQTEAEAPAPEETAEGGGSEAAEGGGGLGGGTEIERMVAEGKVYLDQRGQVVTGDRGEFEMKQGLLVVTGNEVVLTEGNNIVVGCRFTMNSLTGKSQVDSCPNSTSAGRVRMLLQPGSAAP